MNRQMECVCTASVLVLALLAVPIDAADIDEALLAEVYARSKAVSKAYENTILGIEHTYSFPDGRPHPVTRYSVAQKAQFVRVELGSSRVIPNNDERITAYVAGPDYFFRCQRDKRNQRFVLRDIMARKASDDVSSYEAMLNSIITAVLGTHCIFGMPLWRVQDHCMYLKIAACERVKQGETTTVKLAFTQREPFAHSNGPTDAHAEIDPARGWVITMFRHAVVDKHQVMGYRQFNYEYDGEISGVGRLKAIHRKGFEPDAKTRSSPNNGIYRVVEFANKDLPDSYFTPQAFGIELTDKADRRSFPPIAYLLTATAFLLAIYVCMRLRRPRSDR